MAWRASPGTRVSGQGPLSLEFTARAAVNNDPGVMLRSGAKAVAGRRMRRENGGRDPACRGNSSSRCSCSV